MSVLNPMYAKYSHDVPAAYFGVKTDTVNPLFADNPAGSGFDDDTVLEGPANGFSALPRTVSMFLANG